MSQKEEWKDGEGVKLEGYSRELQLSLSWDPDEAKI